MTETILKVRHPISSMIKIRIFYYIKIIIVKNVLFLIKLLLLLILFYSILLNTSINTFHITSLSLLFCPVVQDFPFSI